MTSHAYHDHTQVWIDHNEARIFHYDRDLEPAGESVVKNPQAPVHLHHKSGEHAGSGHVAVDHPFLELVTVALGDPARLLVTGPSSAKQELVKHLSERHPALGARVVGVVPLDHPRDGELKNQARSFFKHSDRLEQLGVPHGHA